nr:bifunctional riboflavin biosynthesis protein RIBA 1, chloroplastic-like [Tanacetum cinerariifolium]
GGLGVSSLYALNRGLLFKWIWRFYMQDKSLWVRVIKAMYGDKGKIDAKVKTAADYLVSNRYPGVRWVCHIGPWPNVRTVYGSGRDPLLDKMPMNLNLFNALHYTQKNSCNGHEKEVFVGTRLCPTSKNGYRVSCVRKNVINMSSGIKVEAESIAFGTLAAEMVTSDSISFSDDASSVTPEAMSFFVKHVTGIVCVTMKGEDLDKLQLPLMVTRNEDKLCTAFTVSVDAKHGTTTGVSASDRAATIKALASKESKPDDFNRPGHIFPLKYKEGGVLKRAGHTEASVDLVELTGFDPVGVITEIVDDDGSMARLPKLKEFVKRGRTLKSFLLLILSGIEGKLINYLSPMADRWTWALENSGEFTVSSVRKHIDDKLIPGAGSIGGLSMCRLKLMSMRGRMITRWWDVSYEDFVDYDDWRTWITNLRLPSKNKMMLEEHQVSLVLSLSYYRKK